MTDSNLGESLLKQQAAPAQLPAEQAAHAMRRDRIVIRSLIAFTIAIWLAALAGIILITYCYFDAWVPKQQQLMTDHDLSGDQLEEVNIILTHAVGLGVMVVVASVAALALATLCTLLVTILGRRATLRQVNANLALIAAQLKELSGRPRA